MFKLVATIACFATVLAAPLDTKVDSGPKNFTEKASDAKTVPYPYVDTFNARPFPFYTAPTPSRPIFSAPLMRPSASLPSPYLVDGKTAHLRPQLYQSPSQFYSYPLQSYQYPQSVYSGYQQSYQPIYQPSYQPTYQTYYSSHGLYRQSKEPEVMQPPTAQIVIGKAQFEQIPLGADQSVGVIPRDTGLWSPYTLSQENLGQLEDIRRRDIVVDDKYNLQIHPAYSMDRLRVPKSARSAEDVSEYQSPEDDLYYVMNKYDQQPMAKTEETFQPVGDAHTNTYWMPPVFNSPVLPTNLRDSKPYSSENILSAMNQFYAGKYYEQMVKANRNSPAAKSAEPSDDKVLQTVAEEIVNIIKAKKTEPSPAAKSEEPKETTTAPKTNA